MKYLITTFILILAILLLASLLDVHAETVVLKFTVTTSSYKSSTVARSEKDARSAARSPQKDVKKLTPSVLPVKKLLTQDASLVREHVLEIVSKYYSESELIAFDNLIKSESGWRPNAINPSSGACGLGQSLPCEKMGCTLEDVDCQTQWIVGYIVRRYGSPVSAWDFHLQNNWY